MKITVTQEDIDKGERQNGCRCPIARAIAREGGGGPTVSTRQAILDIDSVVHIAELPQPARDFIAAFDNDGEVQPFTFEIEPQPYDLP